MNTRIARPHGGPGAVLTMVTLLIGGMTGCDSGGTEGLPPPPEPAAGPVESTVDPTEQAVLAAYRGSVQAMVVAQAAGDPEHPELTRYFAEQTPALSNIRSGIERHQARATYYAGDLRVVTAEVTALDLTARPPEATIESCLDDTDYRLVRRADGAPVPGAAPGGRYPVTSRSLQDREGRWYVVETNAHWDEPC